MRTRALFGWLLAIITLGLVRIDRPPRVRLKKLRWPRRGWLAILARFHGRRDGRWDIPGAGDRLPPPELIKLKQQGDSVLRRLAASWARSDTRLAGDCMAIISEQNAVRQDMDQLQPEVERTSNARSEYEKDLEDAKRANSKREPDERWRISKWVYGLALVVIFIGEFPLNAIAFRLFGESEYLTYLMTAGLAVVLISCAHALGVLMRHKRMSYRDERIVLVLIFVPIAVIAGIAIIRAIYLSDASKLADTGAFKNISIGLSTAIFLMINLLIYVGAFVLSYLHHNPEREEIERLEKATRKSGRRLRRSHKRLDRDEKRELRLVVRSNRWGAAREGLLREAHFEAHRQKDLFEVLMQVYSASNRLAREKRIRKAEKQRAKLDRRAQRRGGVKEPEAVVRVPERSPRALQKWPEIVIPSELLAFKLAEQTANGRPRPRATRPAASTARQKRATA
jgi:hypothetical protein